MSLGEGLKCVLFQILFAAMRVGDRVKIAAWTDSFMQGFAYGTVKAVGRNYALVSWTLNDKISRKFSFDRIEKA